MFLLFAGEKKVRPCKLPKLSYTESLRSPIGVGLTFTTFSLSSTAVLSHHSALCTGESTAGDSSRDIGPSFLMLGETGKGWGKTSDCFSCSFPSPKNRESDGDLFPLLLHCNGSAGRTAYASACWWAPFTVLRDFSPCSLCSPQG